MDCLICYTPKTQEELIFCHNKKCNKSYCKECFNKVNDDKGKCCYCFQKFKSCRICYKGVKSKIRICKKCFSNCIECKMCGKFYDKELIKVIESYDFNMDYSIKK
jgi:hypothetical protein